MKIVSSAFQDNQKIPPKYTCDGEDISPPLEISDVPRGSKSLVLIVEDPDAPGGTFDHWLVWNISPSAFIEEGAFLKGAVEGVNSFGKKSYGGPCPPSGLHHYRFKVYALNTTLDLSPSVGKEEVLGAIEGCVLAEAELTGLYQRDARY